MQYYLTFPLLDCSEFGNFVITLIKTFDFSTIYTTIPYSLLKDRLKEFV
jgi:hypothetical protein